MIRFACERVAAGEHIAGVLLAPAEMALGEAIEQIQLIYEVGEEFDFVNQVWYLPI